MDETSDLANVVWLQQGGMKHIIVDPKDLNGEPLVLTSSNQPGRMFWLQLTVIVVNVRHSGLCVISHKHLLQ